jgi:hypothetical protein
MNIIIGQAATGDKFYIREKLIKKLWKKIVEGNNILVAAPRRLGKTSIMLYCEENPIETYDVVYLITESVNSQKEFYRKLVKGVIDKLSTSKRITNSLQKIISSTKITSIGTEGISFENKDIDYFEEFRSIAEQLELQECKLVLMVDEFAQTVENIMQDEGNSSAIKFLESVREIRIDPKISNKIQFLFAGSIGLENIVSQLNVVNTINDLYSFKVPPFTNAEAIDYINTIPFRNEEYDFLPNDIDYLLTRLEWNIPYFINIILDEIEKICDDTDTNDINKEIIDIAFDNSLKNKMYFEHWHSRLRKSYKKSDYNFSKTILNIAAEKSFVTKAEISDLAVELNILEKYKDILSELEYDGYVNNQEDSEKYVFNSPLLKAWWFNNVTN